ncbi:MAG: beta-ketoacyl synthase [Bacteroidales bacterium]|nr:beta-ketoacyl synthase [Bacteroidales bacterium]
MIAIAGDNIISSLGFTAEENYRSVKRGLSGVKRCEGLYDIPEPFMASLISQEALNANFAALLSSPADEEDYTPLERAAILSASDAISQAGIRAASGRTVFIFSSTKGNIEYLDAHIADDRLYLWRSAQRIASFFGNTNPPVVVSNACISGAYALLTAQREILSGRYDAAVVTGADRLSKFIVSGFQSFKALSGTVCKPFDASRDGLNLGEAAATIVLQRKQEATKGDILLETGAVRNDANHISGPSRTGEGLYLALDRIMQGRSADSIAFVNAHGTATPYNDEMESIALHRAGLDAVPVNALKACFGHTLGAAGVLESIISARALRDGIVLPTQGFEQTGTTYPLPVTLTETPTEKSYFIKVLSGFGGCNAALLFKKA